jgi:hypothetical protein
MMEIKIGFSLFSTLLLSRITKLNDGDEDEDKFQIEMIS